MIFTIPMRKVILHYELPGNIGNGSLGTESVDEVVTKLQHLKQVVKGIGSPTRHTGVGLGWYSKDNKELLPNLTLG